MVGDVPVSLAREWVEADVRITTGFVEPHFFAGFSGGPKMVAPGSGRARHGARTPQRPTHRRSTGDVGGHRGQPGPRCGAGDRGVRTGVDFAVDVLLNDEQASRKPSPASVFAMHAAACAAARDEAMQPVDRRSTIVVTTNSGYPLDQNLYQAVKGMSARPRRWSPGGTIICAAECRDGLPDHGSYGDAPSRRVHRRPSCSR